LFGRAHGAPPFDGDDVDFGFRQVGVTLANDLGERQHRPFDAIEGGDDLQKVVDNAGREKVSVQARDGEGEAVVLCERIVLQTASPQPFGAASLEETKIGGVIDAAGKVGVLVIDSDIKAMPVSNHAVPRHCFDRLRGGC
jgi:hypothetical protein